MISLTSPVWGNQTFLLQANKYDQDLILSWIHILFFFFFTFWTCRTACRILVPQPGIETAPLALEARSLNHWTAGEVPTCIFFKRKENYTDNGDLVFKNMSNKRFLYYLLLTRAMSSQNVLKYLLHVALPIPMKFTCIFISSLAPESNHNRSKNLRSNKLILKFIIWVVSQYLLI